MTSRGGLFQRVP